jgi:hypothetical protein
MAYYLTGDYYKGDYYRGGGRGDIFGSLIKGIGKVAGSIFQRTPVGMAVTGITSLVGGQGLPAPRTGGGLTFPGGVGIHPARILPGGKPFLTREGGAVRPGYHLDKKTRSYEVRNRSMNPANPRALRRAIRREHGFVALAKRVLRGTGITIGRRSFGGKKKIGARR